MTLFIVLTYHIVIAINNWETLTLGLDNKSFGTKYKNLSVDLNLLSCLVLRWFEVYP